MTLEEFKNYAHNHNIVPVFERITADLLTPVLAFLKIRSEGSNHFLLESVEGIGRLARYSFIGKNPRKVFYNRGENLTIIEKGQKTEIKKNIFDYISEEIAKFNQPKIEGIPDFSGGIVGYLGYEIIGLIENVIKFTDKCDLDTPDSYFGIYNTLIIFDHFKHQILILTHVQVDNFRDLAEQYEEAKLKIKKIKEEINRPIDFQSNFKADSISPVENREEFYEYINKCKQNIFEGDVFQIVMSKRFNTEFSGDLLNVYRALRIINPSPYMYFIEFENDFTVIGTSPEDLLKVKDQVATILPIAGTRKRGRDEQHEAELEKDLLSDPKELAEHTMLVDLARNDLGRVCEYDTVKVTEKMRLQKFSHVMHIVSRVEGKLSSDKNCIDALKASFPAGTVTGAPKIRAVQLLNGYENLRRNVYAGAVGYIDFSGNLDMCIAIRTLFAKGNKIYWQAGAGIVADSKPELELKEIENKSAVLVSALKYAEVIDEDSCY